MKIKIEFSDENAAFEDNGIPEYEHILRQVIERVDAAGTFPLFDSNGNRVGTVKIETEEESEK